MNPDSDWLNNEKSNRPAQRSDYPPQLLEDESALQQEVLTKHVLPANPELAAALDELHELLASG